MTDSEFCCPSKTRPVATYTLNLCGPAGIIEDGWRVLAQLNYLLRETRENLDSLLPDGYSVLIEENGT